MKMAAAVLFLAGSLGCGSSEEQTAETKPETPETTREEPAAAQQPAPEQTVPETPEPQAESVSRTTEAPSPSATMASGETVWAPGKEGALVRGLDGGFYEAYLPSVVEEAQQALKDKGLYAGPISGVLDEATREALGRFQEQENLQVTGVPSPETRERLGLTSQGGDANVA